MNKHIKAITSIPCGFIKMGWTKLFHWNTFHASLICSISPCSEITLEGKGELRIGYKLKMRDGAKIRVRSKAQCIIGNDVFVNSNNIIVCRERIEIGDGCQFGPNVQIYDHDHDFRADGGIKAGIYKSLPIKIGKNVWIGANSVVLRGSEIGDNSVIGAGSVIKGTFPENSVIIQKRENEIRGGYWKLNKLTREVLSIAA